METKILNANALKLIAIVAMTVDHLAWALWPDNAFGGAALVMHMFGRLTMPIMCFFVAEGYHYTRDWRKYLARLFGFALVAHFAFVFCFNYQDPWSFIPFAHGGWQEQTSVMWGLAWGLVLIRVWDTQWHWSLKWLVTLAVVAVTLPADWACVTPLLIWAFWANREHFARQMLWLVAVVGVYSLVWILVFHSAGAVLNFMVLLCLPVLYLYNGQRGQSPRLNRFLQWFFYIYYPLHLVIIGILL